MATSFISTRTEQFAYFDEQLGHPDWTGKRVLDFGGSAGNILRSANNRIEPANYCAIDVSRDAIALGKELHPEGSFLFYDRYSFEFNATGIVGLPIPDPGLRFDIILAFSVFTHTSKAETLELVSQLRNLLADGGRLAFTFLDPNWVSPVPRDVTRTPESLNAPWVAPSQRAVTQTPAGATNLHWGLLRHKELSPDLDVDGLLALAAARPELTWTTLVNNEHLYFEPDEDGTDGHRESRHYLTFCTVEYMRTLYPDARILPPGPPEWQHCAVLPKNQP